MHETQPIDRHRRDHHRRCTHHSLTALAAATRATDPLAAYDHQTIAWRSCQLDPDDSEGLQLDQAGARAHGVYLFAGSACVDAVNNYLDTGRLPATDTTC